jgi:predicted amidohydrolase YtcJ
MMLKAAIVLFTISLLSGCASPGSNASGEFADMVIRGGAVYTLDEDLGWAEAVAIRDGKIVFVGPNSDAGAFIAEFTEVVEIGDGMLLPGFHDSHMHPMRAGNRFLRCQMQGLAWPDEVLAELERCKSGLRPGQWLRGVNLDDGLFDSGELHKAQLDAIAPDRPAFITNRSGFLGWVNSTALALAGIDAATPDPRGGVIARAPGTGEPSGVLRLNAVGQVYQHIPEPDEQDLREALRLASKMANGFGITSSSEAQTVPQNWLAFVAADRAGELTLRIQASLAWEFQHGLKQLSELVQRRDAHSSPMFRADSVKLFLDGSLTANQGAALLAPYAGTDGDYGPLSDSDRDAIRDAVVAIDAAGLNVHLHALGDRAVRYGLDGIQAAIETNPPWDRRPHMAHLVMVHPGDLPRFARLGVTADFQALWAHLDDDQKASAAALGHPRAQRMIAIRDMLDSGARVVLGSDWTSDSMNPLYSIQVAITRRPPDGSEPAWLPEQRITLEEALRAYTIDGAWLAGREDLTGSIEVGKAADLVLLEKNLFEVDPMEISRVKVLRTLLDGNTVYRRTWSQP